MKDRLGARLSVAGYGTLVALDNRALCQSPLANASNLLCVGKLNVFHLDSGIVRNHRRQDMHRQITEVQETSHEEGAENADLDEQNRRRRRGDALEVS